jgi:hypothetical protein
MYVKDSEMAQTDLHCLSDISENCTNHGHGMQQISNSPYRDTADPEFRPYITMRTLIYTSGNRTMSFSGIFTHQTSSQSRLIMIQSKCYISKQFPVDINKNYRSPSPCPAHLMLSIFIFRIPEELPHSN